MTHRLWLRLKSLYGRALDESPSGRARLVEGVSDSNVRDQLQALDRFDEALKASREAGQQSELQMLHLARVLCRMGRAPEALAMLKEAEPETKTADTRLIEVLLKYWRERGSAADLQGGGSAGRPRFRCLFRCAIPLRGGSGVVENRAA